VENCSNMEQSNQALKVDGVEETGEGLKRTSRAAGLRGLFGSSLNTEIASA
jgi:hypothetical protein